MDFSLTTLFVLPSGNIAPDGFKRENLQPTQFGVFNSRYKAVTTAGDAMKSPYIVFGQGRIEKVPGLTHKYSDKISRGSLIEWYKTTSSPVAKSQITYVGFDGLDNTKTLKVSCNEDISLIVRARSNYIDLGFNYGLTRSITVKAPCCADCSDNCDSVDPRIIANLLAEKFKEDTYLTKFFTATPIFECTEAADEPVTIATVTYCVSFCDAGDAGSLSAVQAQYVNDVVTRSARNGSISTYQLERLGTDATPAAVIVTLPVALAICDTCPAGYSLQNAQEQYIIEVPLAGSEDLSTANARQTFANTTKARYIAPKVFNGATAVDPTTDQITIVAHGLVANEAVTYSNGGGTTIVGLTNGATYFVKTVVDADNITLSATKGGVVKDITADGVGASHSLTTASTATFLENTGGTAKILISVDSDNAALVGLLGDSVVTLSSTGAVCVPPAGTSNSWSACDTGFKTQRSLTLSLTDDCTGGELAEIQAFYPNETITLLESANCNSSYKMVQTSNTVSSDCGFNELPSFDSVQEYKGFEWTPLVETLTGSGCVAGLKIEGRPLDKYGKTCDPMNFPHEFDKLTFEVFMSKGVLSQDNYTYDRCDNFPVTTTQRSTYVIGTGDEIFELEKRYYSYQTTMKSIYHDVNFNGAFERYSDPSLFYDTYVIKFASPDLNTWSDESRQDETVIIAVPSGTGASIEQFLLGYFGQEKFTAGILSE